MRLFLDTSVLLAASGSAVGAALYVFRRVRPKAGVGKRRQAGRTPNAPRGPERW